MAFEYLIGILILLWSVYWNYMYPKIKFSDKKYRDNKELMQFDYEKFIQTTRHLEQIAIVLIVAAFTIPQEALQFIVFYGGITILIFSFMYYGKGQRVANRIREKLKDK